MSYCASGFPVLTVVLELHCLCLHVVNMLLSRLLHVAIFQLSSQTLTCSKSMCV